MQVDGADSGWLKSMQLQAVELFQGSYQHCSPLVDCMFVPTNIPSWLISRFIRVCALTRILRSLVLFFQRSPAADCKVVQSVVFGCMVAADRPRHKMSQEQQHTQRIRAAVYFTKNQRVK